MLGQTSRRRVGRPRVASGERRVAVSAAVQARVVAALQAHAEAMDRSLSSLVDEILREWTVRNFEEEGCGEPANPSSTLNVT